MDLTGGAPEINYGFKLLVEAARATNKFAQKVCYQNCYECVDVGLLPYHDIYLSSLHHTENRKT